MLKRFSGLFLVSMVSYSLAAVPSAMAGKLVSQLLAGDVLCSNEKREITFSQDLSEAVVSDSDKPSRVLPVTYHHNTGGSGQYLILSIPGLDGLHQTTEIKDIFHLVQGTPGLRAEQVGHGNKVLEQFTCAYTPFARVGIAHEKAGDRVFFTDFGPHTVEGEAVATEVFAAMDKAGVERSASKRDFRKGKAWIAEQTPAVNASVLVAPGFIEVAESESEIKVTVRGPAASELFGYLEEAGFDQIPLTTVTTIRGKFVSCTRMKLTKADNTRCELRQPR